MQPYNINLNTGQPGCRQSDRNCADHGLGNTVIIEHVLADGAKKYSLYAHLASFSDNIEYGSCVDKGTVLGTVGGSGYERLDRWTKHVHFEIKNENVLGAPSAPSSYWGYTPNHPDGYGYVNPNNYIGKVSAKPCNNGLSANWTSPSSSGQTITSRYYTLRANVTGATNGVTRVDFNAKYNGAWRGLKSDASQEYTWDLCNPEVPNGNIELGLEVYDGAGNHWVYSEHSPNYHITKSFNCPTGQWRVQYFNNRDASGTPCAEEPLNTPFVFLSWGEEHKCGSDVFSALVSSTQPLTFQPGTYQFYMYADDNAFMECSSMEGGNAILQLNWYSPPLLGVPTAQETSRNFSRTGQCTMNIRFRDNAGLAWVSAWWSAPGYQLPSEGQDPNQWFAQYYANPNLEGKALVSVNEGTANGISKTNWGNGSPGWGLPGNYWSARFQRTVSFECGDYVFEGSVDDDIRLYIEDLNLKLLDDWNSSAGGFSTADRPVRLDGDHRVKVEYKEWSGSAALTLGWRRVTPCTRPPATPAPQSPSDGTVFTEGDPITLSWSATGNEYYAEVWGGPAGTIFTGWQAGTSNNIGAQWAGYTYSWHVKARNSAGESGWSATSTFTVKPGKPLNLTAQAASCNQVNLSWADGSGNEEGYKVYWTHTGSLQVVTQIGQVGPNATSYQNTGLSGSTNYTYYVTSFRGGIESDPSNIADIVTPACPLPATKLAFTTQPSGGQAGSAFATQPIVAVQDANNRTITSDNTSVVTLVKGASSTGSGMLSCDGGLSKTVVNGVATFSGCKFSEAGTYIIRASGGSLSSVDSDSFPVTLPPVCRDAQLTGAPASPQLVGTSVMLTASASGCSRPEYRFWAYSAATGWRLLRDWGAATLAWDTAGLPAGEYWLVVHARRQGATADWEAYAIAGYTLR